MRACHCGKSLEGRTARTLYCSNACRKVAFRAGLAGGDEPCDPRELGPPVPLDGIRDSERIRLTTEKVLRLLADDVPPEGVSERTGIDCENIRRTAQRYGLRLERCGSAWPPVLGQ